MEKGTFAEFSKFGIDFEDIILWELVMDREAWGVVVPEVQRVRCD